MQPLDSDTIEKTLKGLRNWIFEDDQIRKTFQFADFSEALAFMVRVGIEAEKDAHHPEFQNVYNRVDIRLNTHDAGGKVTEKDLRLAKKIENLYQG